MAIGIVLILKVLRGHNDDIDDLHARPDRLSDLYNHIPHDQGTEQQQTPREEQPPPIGHKQDEIRRYIEPQRQAPGGMIHVAVIKNMNVSGLQ